MANPLDLPPGLIIARGTSGSRNTPATHPITSPDRRSGFVWLCFSGRTRRTISH